MKKKHLVIGLVIVILSSYYAFRNVSIEELGNALKAVQYIYLVPAVMLIALTFLFRAMRWKYLVRSVKEVKTAHLFSPLMIGFMGNILPARAGEIVRAYMLGKKESVSFSASFATIVVERLLDMLVFLALIIGVLLFSADVLVQGSGDGSNDLVTTMKSFGYFSFALSIAIFVFFILLQYKNELAMKIVDICTRPFPEKFREKIVGMVHSFTEGLHILKDVRGVMASLFLSVLVWITATLFYYPLYLAFGIESDLPMMTSLIILTLTIGIFISVAPTPGFLGSFHLACVVALHDIFAIPEPVAASYGIVAWLVTMGFIMLAGLFFIMKDNVSFSELATKSEQAD